jgi:hypothetical protein
VGYEGGPLHQVARRIAAHRQLREQNQPGARGPRPLRKSDNLGRIAAEVPYGGVDLSQGNLHKLSVMGARADLPVPT